MPKAKLQAHLAKLRRTRFPHWKAVGSQSVQAICDRLYKAWEAFFAGDIKRPPTFPFLFRVTKCLNPNRCQRRANPRAPISG